MPRPVAVVTHGAGGRPEQDCGRWKQLLREQAFVLCTRGRATNSFLPEAEQGFFYDGHHELGKEVERAMSALLTRYGARVDATRPIFTGFSQGATMGSLWLHERTETSPRFARVALVEGGSGQWNVALSERAHQNGLEKVLIVCGQASCAESGRASARYLERAGVDVRFEYAQGGGHTDDGPVGRRVTSSLEWFLAGDARYANEAVPPAPPH